MDVIMVPFEKLEWGHEYILEGYQWGYQCGESYQTQEAAENCRKCRRYLAEEPTRVYYTPLPEVMRFTAFLQFFNEETCASRSSSAMRTYPST